MAQIEIEKKFLLTDQEITKLTDQAEFLGQKVFTDIYFDNEDYDLTKNDIWFRERAGHFELKLPIKVKNKNDNFVNQYREIENEDEICKELHISKSGDLTQDLKSIGYFPFCKIETTRKKYKKDGFNIDVDAMDFGYNIVEIELLVGDESDSGESMKKIVDYAKKYNFEVNASIRGKVIEYLYQKDKKHYNALVACGQVIEN